MNCNAARLCCQMRHAAGSAGCDAELWEKVNMGGAGEGSVGYTSTAEGSLP